MNAFVAGFADELVKTADLAGLVERAIGARGSPMRKAIARAALLGAGTTAAQAALQPPSPGEGRHLLRHAVGGAVAGAMTGRAFPGWFGKSQRVPEAG